MSEDSLIMTTLLGIKESIGELRQIGIAQGSAFTSHCIADENMAKDILQLQLEAAKKRGSARVWNLLGSALGAILGAIAGYFSRH